MAATHTNKRRASASCDTAQVDYACRNQEDLTRMLAYNFPLVFHIEFETIFPENFLSETDRKTWSNAFAIGGLMYVNFSIIIFARIFPPI